MAEADTEGASCCDASEQFMPSFTAGPACAPSMLITFINMVLFKGSVPPKGCDEFMYSGQKGLQRFFVVLSLLCVAWMLLAKPTVLIMRHCKAHQTLSSHLVPAENGMDVEVGSMSGTAHKDSADGAPAPRSSEDHNLGEIFIHQGIHTIEYVLGSVSHTASYL